MGKQYEADPATRGEDNNVKRSANQESESADHKIRQEESLKINS